MRLLGLFILIGLGFSAPSFAASFACAKAETSVERAICSNPELSKLDEDLAEAFSAARAGGSAEARDVVLAGQREWLDFTSRACTETAEPLNGDYDADGASCLAGLFQNRITALQRNGAVDGLSFYFVDRYAAYLDSEVDEYSWIKVAAKEFSYPQLDGNDRLSEVFNANMRKISAYALTEFDPDHIDGTTDTSNVFELAEVNEQRISVVETSYFYGHGAAHGNYGIFYHHFLRAAERPLGVDDVFQTDGWVDAVTPLVILSLKRELGADGVWEDLSDVPTAIIDPARWSFSDAGIAFQFQPYEVAAYAAGAPVGEVTWAELRVYLTPGVEELLKP